MLLAYYIQLNILIVDLNSVKGELKVIDCIVLKSVQYWCPNGSCFSLVSINIVEVDLNKI